METRCTTARSAFITGCALLAASARAYAEFAYSEDTNPAAPPPATHATALSNTLGNGFGYRLPLGDTIGLRAERYLMGGRQTVGRDLYRYELNARMQSRSLILDWRPFAGVFHANIGIFINDYAMNAAGESHGRIALSGLTADTEPLYRAVRQIHITPEDVERLVAEIRTFDADTANDVSDFLSEPEVQRWFDGDFVADALNSTMIDISGAVNVKTRARWNRLAPYLGFRWTNLWQNRDGFFYNVDLGFLYVGRPDVDISVSGPLVDAVHEYSDTTLQRYIDRQEKQAEKKLGRYRVIPLVSLGAGYRF